MQSIIRRWRDAGYRNIYGTEILERWCARQGSKSRGVIRVLDVGCGSGRDLLAIRQALGANREVELYGIECTKDLLRAATSHGVKASSIDLETTALPYPDGFFDFVLANQVLEHLKNWIWALQEQVRVTRRGGNVVIGVPNLAALHNRILVLFGRQPSCLKANGPHVRGFTLHELTRLLKTTPGIEIIASSGTFVYGFPPKIGKGLGRVFPALSATVLVSFRKTADSVPVISLLGDDARFETNFFVGPS